MRRNPMREGPCAFWANTLPLSYTPGPTHSSSMSKLTTQGMDTDWSGRAGRW